MNSRSTQPRTSLLLQLLPRGRVLNPSQTQMFLLPSLLIMSIAATRMYRSLTDFGTGSADMYDNITSSLLSLSLLAVTL